MEIKDIKNKSDKDLLAEYIILNDAVNTGYFSCRDLTWHNKMGIELKRRGIKIGKNGHIIEEMDD